MEKDNVIPWPESNQSQLKTLLSELLSEPFAKDHQFETTPLESIGKLLEESKETINSEENEETRFSYENCTLKYCMLLFELDNAHGEPSADVLKQTPLEILDHHSHTATVAMGMPLPEEALPELSSNDPITEPMPIESPVKELMELDFSTPTLEPEPATATAQTQDDVPMLWDIPEKPAAPLEFSPETSPSIENTMSAVESFITEGIPAQVAEEALKKAEPALTQDAAQEYWSLSKFFRRLIADPSFPLPSKYLFKLIGQNIISSLEAETAETVIPKMTSFWSVKNEALGALFTGKKTSGELKPELRKVIEDVCQGDAAILIEGKLPWAGLISSLRYTYSTQSWDQFKPTLMDLACLAIFFGGHSYIAELGLTQAQAITGLNDEESLELGLRLIRLQRYKLKINNIRVDLSQEDSGIIENDFHAILKLFNKMNGAEEVLLERSA